MQEYNFNYLDYKKRLKNPIKFNFVFITLILILLLGTCVFFNQNRQGFSTYYFVEVGEYSTFSQANKTASEVTLKSGAGFVYFDKSYHVLAGFYLTQESAKTVSKNIANEYPNTKIFTLSAAKFNNKKTYSKTENSTIKNVIENNQNTINSIYQLSLSLDKNELSFNSAITQILALKDDFVCSQKLFEDTFKNEKIYFNTNKKLNEICNSLTRLTKSTEQELKQKIKYELINITITHTLILNEIC